MSPIDAPLLATLHRLGEAVEPALAWTPAHTPPSAWAVHGPFAQWLTARLRPRLFVELGVHHGFSFLAFLDALRAAGEADARAVGVDTWRGDPHAGFYGEEVFQDLTLKTAPYGALARLRRGDFAEAAEDFEPGSIDLLHIDGAHDAPSVERDVETYLPLLSQGGVIALHDVTNRTEGFGVHAVWKDLLAAHPGRTFLMPQGSGLGLVAPHGAPESLKVLFQADPEEAARIALLFTRLGAGLDKARLDAESARLSELLAASEYNRVMLEKELIEARGAPLHVRLLERARETAEARAEAQTAEERLGAYVADRNRWKAKEARTAEARDAARAKIERLESALDVARSQASQSAEALKAERARAAQARRDDDARAQALQIRLERAEAVRDAFLNSASWRITKPLRALRGGLKKRSS